MNTRRNLFLLKFDRILSQGLWSQLLLLAILLFLAFLLANILLLLSPVDWASYCEGKGISRWIAPFYLLIDGNAFTSVYEGGASSWTVFLSCIIYIVGVFLFTGMMVSVMTNIVERRVEKHRDGLVFYLKEGHYIIMGYDDTISSVIHHIFNKDPNAYILIFTSRVPIQVREKLLKSFTQEQLKKVIINYGHRTSKEDYSKLHLESAREIFIVGYLGLQTHDAINVECVDAICQYLADSRIKSHPSRITCIFRDLDTYAAFKTTEIFTKVTELGIEFVPFNYHTGWARQVLTDHHYCDISDGGKVYSYPAVYRGGISKEDNHFVHLVFVGTTNFAVALATEAAHILHFPNFIRDNKLKTLITFIEVNADREKDEFITRYRHFFEVQPYLYRDLSDRNLTTIPDPQICNDYLKATDNSKDGVDYGFLDVQFEFIKGDVFSNSVQKLISQWANDGTNRYLNLFVALANHRTNFVMAMNMPDEVYDNAIPIFIRQGRSDNFVTNLREASKGFEPYYTFINGSVSSDDTSVKPSRYSNIFPFGMDETAFQSNDIHLKRAKLINYLYSTADYSTYRFKGALALDAIPEKDIWEDAEKKWNDKGLTVALKWSNLYNAYTIDTKLATIRNQRGLASDDASQDTKMFSESEIKMMAEVEHNRWNVEKLLMGYRKPSSIEDAYSICLDNANNADETKKLSESKDKLKKNKKHYIHHDIRPFERLDHISELDYEFSRSIPWILKMTSDNRDR